MMCIISEPEDKEVDNKITERLKNQINGKSDAVSKRTASSKRTSRSKRLEMEYEAEQALAEIEKEEIEIRNRKKLILKKLELDRARLLEKSSRSTSMVDVDEI